MDSRDLADIFTSDNDLYYFEKQLARDPKRDNTRGDVLARYQSQVLRVSSQEMWILPEDGTEIQIKDLRAGLNAYGFDTQYQN